MKNNILEALNALKKLNENINTSLYHGTSLSNLFKILESNTLKVGRLYAKGAKVCLTRSLSFAKSLSNKPIAVLVLNQDKLKQNYKLTPTSDYANFINSPRARFDSRISKAEETIDRDINNIIIYIEKIIIFNLTDQQIRNELNDIISKYNINIEYK